MTRTKATTAPAVGATAGVWAAAHAFLDYPLLAQYGATADETRRTLPGDDLLPNALQSTRAITIDAPPEAVWPWLAQMGQDRAGFYSHDWLERVFGAEIHNADRLHSEWQHLAIGDTIWPYPERKLRPMAKRSSDVGGWKVVALECCRSLVLRSNAGRWVWALVLEPIGNGRTRLMARTRFARPEHAVNRVLDAIVGQPAHFVMETGVLRGVKQRAERGVRSGNLGDDATSGVGRDFD
ncbi:MAG TPA: hypothetical protein VGJ60_27920 [Chloroflexota bacterium]|jgi:hypothetical protein